MTPRIILVHGLPCSGKTSIAQKLASHFNLPLVEKDGIKEILFDTLGWSDRQRSKELGNASYEIIFYLISAHVAAGQDLVVDCNFHPEFHNEKIREILKKTPFCPLQVLCWAQGEVIVERFQKRTGRRHPGHGDESLIDEIAPDLLQGKAEALDIDGDIYWLETTDFESIDFESMWEWVEKKKIFASSQ
jgi:predicted kinase